MSAQSQSTQPFALIVLAWESVADLCQGDHGALRSAIERLCALGVDIAVAAGDDLATVDGCLVARPGIEGRLFFVLSNGAESYSVGPGGPRLVERSHPVDRWERALQEAVEAVCAVLGELGVHARLAGGSRGYRMLDLAPEYRADMAVEGDLRQAVEGSLRAVGLAGLGAVVGMARDVARARGLPRPVLTTDGRTLTIGLSGMADAARWVVRNLLRGRNREPGDMLLIGSQFGTRGGVPGRESRLLVPELVGATVISVGDEERPPPSVQQVGGGPPAALKLLDRQIQERERVARLGFPQVSDDPAWLFRVEGFDPFREREVETWLTVANGHVGTRGSLEEGSAASTPATFVAGVFGDGTADPPVRQPVPAPDWLCLRLSVDGMPLTLANGEIVEHRRTLDMRQGLVLREWCQRERGGRTVRVRSARFASLDDRSVMAERAEASLEDARGQLVWEGCLGISHAGGPIAETAVELLEPGVIALSRGRNGGSHGLAAVTIPVAGSPVVRRVLQERDLIGGFVEPGEPASVDRLAVVRAARSRPPSAGAVCRSLEAAVQTGFDELLRRHRDAWLRRWDIADVVIDGDPEAQMAVRFAIYHMIASADPDNPSVSVGARGLSGMSYFCHVFWDTEIFVVPFFIYTWPEAARTLLAYRYRLLPGARQKAQTMGHRGALFPWESADTGHETTPPYGYGPGGEKVPILSGIMEHHISADVAWAVWEYWMVTGDDGFMVEMGAELLLDTARFWASRASYEADGRYHIRLVVGPDEYHDSVDDNAYTNVLARWNIRRALDALAWLRKHHAEEAERLMARLDLSKNEVRSWRAVADGLVDGFDPATGLYEQFAGFYELRDLDPSLLYPKPRPADLLLGRELTQASKVVKQADVVMLCHLLTDEIDAETMRRNYEYYEPVTVHGSSLSPATHAAVAAEIGLPVQAMEAFRLACAVDLADNMGNAARGLHLATMGGVWQAVVMGFAGVRRRGAALAMEPRLPSEWSGLRFAVRFRGAVARFHLEEDRASLDVSGESLPVLVSGQSLTLEPGAHRFQREKGGGWRYVGGRAGRRAP